MKRILCFEDDPDLGALIKYNLEKEGFAFVCSPTGKGAVELCRREKPDLVLLDVMLPDVSGLDVCRSIRSHPELFPLPIIILSARGSETDRVLGLEIGADDYIVKPFSLRELVTRIRLRFREKQPLPALLRAGELVLDGNRRQVLLAGRPVAVTATEFRLLQFLMSRPGIVFSRAQMLDAIWGHEAAVTDRTVDVYILRLRQKIEKASGKSYIRSVRGFGYSFEMGSPETHLQP